MRADSRTSGFVGGGAGIRSIASWVDSSAPWQTPQTQSGSMLTPCGHVENGVSADSGQNGSIRLSLLRSVCRCVPNPGMAHVSTPHQSIDRLSNAKVYYQSCPVNRDTQTSCLVAGENPPSHARVKPRAPSPLLPVSHGNTRMLFSICMSTCDRSIRVFPCDTGKSMSISVSICFERRQILAIIC
jgi:hypothetical protein